MEINIIVSFFSKFIIFFSLYFSIFWLLIILNSINKEKKIKSIILDSITILIPAYNEEENISRTIKSILKTKYEGQLKILVISDGSNDNTVKIAKEFEKRNKNLKVLDFKKNRGKAIVMNEVLEKVTTTYFAVIDADTKISSMTVKNALKSFQINNSGKEIAAVVCQMKPYNKMFNFLERIQLIEYMAVGLMRYLGYKNQLLDMTNGGSFYKTSIVKKVGKFAKNNLTEDFELGVKLRKSNYRIVYAREAKVYTKTPSTIKVLLKQRVRWARGFIQTHKAHKDIFFNKKYGFYGFYQFPFNIFGPIIYFLAIFTISFKLYKSLYEFFYKLLFTPDLIEWFSYGKLNEYFLGLNPKIDLLIMISFLILLILYYLVNRFYEYNYFKKDTLKKIVSFIMYIMIYNYIYIYVWFKSLYLELRNKENKWGTK